MHMVGVTGKGQEKPAARLDHQLRPLEEDFAAIELVIEIINRGYVPVRCMIGDPFALFV